jgi:tetraprenyl-beta-curcumene synthase
MPDRRLAWALVAVIMRYLTTIQPRANRELARWRRLAHAIPDPELRMHVLRPFDADMSAQGAALFAVLAPRRHERQLVSFLVAYVLLWSYVDVRTERDPEHTPRLLGALVDALAAQVQRPAEPYLAALFAICRRGRDALPSWSVVAPFALRLACDGVVVQAINHGSHQDPEARLRAWAHGRPGIDWRERCAAASSPLGIHALMALAATRDVTADQADATATAYCRVSALGVLCDHLIDREEDRALSNHTFLRYYPTPTAQAEALYTLAVSARHHVRSLPNSARHRVILAAMGAMFLSDPKAWTPRSTVGSNAMLEALGSPTPLLLSLLRVRRRQPARPSLCTVAA